MIQNKSLVDKAQSVYSAGKEFLYDHAQREEVVTFHKNNDTRLNIRVNPHGWSLKRILLLIVGPYSAGTRDSETYTNPDLTKVSVTVNGSPNRVYNNGIGANDVWEEASRFFVKAKNKTQRMNLTKFYTVDRFRLLTDLQSMPDYSMHGSGTRFVNTEDGVQLEIERDGSGSRNVNCHVFRASN